MVVLCGKKDNALNDDEALEMDLGHIMSGTWRHAGTREEEKTL